MAIDVIQLLKDMGAMQGQRPEFSQLEGMASEIIAALIIAQAIDRLTEQFKVDTSPGANTGIVPTSPPGD